MASQLASQPASQPVSPATIDGEAPVRPLLRVMDLLGQMWTVPPGTPLYDDVERLKSWSDLVVVPAELLRSDRPFSSLVRSHLALVNTSTELHQEISWRRGYVLLELEWLEPACGREQG